MPKTSGPSYGSGMQDQGNIRPRMQRSRNCPGTGRYWAAALVAAFCVAFAAGSGPAYGTSGPDGPIRVLDAPAELNAGGHWIVKFAAYGGGHGELRISGAGGTVLGDELQFAGLRDGAGGMPYPSYLLHGNALTVPDFGADGTEWQLDVRVDDPGSHRLRFEFGNGTAHADCHAVPANVTSPDGDAAYGLGGTVRISVEFSGPVELDMMDISLGSGDQAGGSFDALDRPVSVAVVVVDGRTYAMVAGRQSSGVQVVDITDPYHPAAVSSILDDRPDRPTGFDTLSIPRGIAAATIDGRTYAIVASFADAGVQVIDMTDPYHPTVASSILQDRLYAPTGFDTLSGPEDVAVAVIDGRTYVLVTSSIKNGVQVIDMTDPEEPAPASSLARYRVFAPTGSLIRDGSFEPSAVAVAQVGQSHYALVATSMNSQFAIFDVSDPHNPAEVAFVDASNRNMALGRIGAVAAARIGGADYALLADQTGDRLHILDISNPLMPMPAMLPRLTLDVSNGGGPAGDRGGTHPRYAVYEGGSGTDHLSFAYAPMPGDAADDLGYVGTSSLELGGSHLRNAMDNTEILPVLPEPGERNSLRSNQQIVIDTAPPAFTSASYDAGNGTIRVAFSEPLGGTIRYDLLHIRDAGQDGGGVALDGATAKGVANDTVTATLTSSQMRDVRGMSAPQLDIDAGAVLDAAANPIDAAHDLPVSVRNVPPVSPAALPSIPFIPFSGGSGSSPGGTAQPPAGTGNQPPSGDLDAPEFTSATYNSCTGALRVKFNEDLGFAIDYSRIKVVGQSRNMTLDNLGGTYSLLIRATISDAAQRNAVGDSPRLEIGAGAVSDASGNPIEATTENIDVLSRVVPAFQSATYNSTSGALTVTFTEQVTFGDVDPSKFHVRESGQSSGGTSLWDVKKDGYYALVFPLQPSHRTIVDGLTTPQLDIEAGAVTASGTAGCPIPASPDNAVTVTS